MSEGANVRLPMERGIVIQQPNVHERSSRIRWSISHQPIQILKQCDLHDYDICFVKIVENDVNTAAKS